MFIKDKHDEKKGFKSAFINLFFNFIKVKSLFLIVFIKDKHDEKILTAAGLSRFF